MTIATLNHFALCRPGLTAVAIAAAMLTGCGGNDPAPSAYDITKDPANIKVEIRRTSYGIPHIVAKDTRSAAYGLAYAYAQDNVCIAANQFMTVAGERAKYLGAGTGNNNVGSDFYFRNVLDQPTVDHAFANISTTTLNAIEGYVAGYNRALADAKDSDFGSDCSVNGVPTDWAKRPLSVNDYKRHLLAIVTRAGLGSFSAAIVAATPPAPTTVAMATARRVKSTDRSRKELGYNKIQLAQLSRSAARFMASFDEQPIGSNGQAFGASVTDNGAGILFGNPHFPWVGAERFYQAHVQVPGLYNVMGATLGPAPMLVIGFNDNLAWTHTVSTGRRFTLFELALSGDNYLVDGVAKPLLSKQVTVDVLVNGTLVPQSRTFYSTEYGPLIVVPQIGATWTATRAYALRDANIDNNRFIDQWWEMGKASNVNQLRDVGARFMALPWVNTVAADRSGNAYYADYSVTPNVSTAHLASCSTSPVAKALAPSRTFVLDGSKTSCNWPSDPAAPAAGIMSAASLPSLIRSDYVGNSNESAWLANPNQLLTGFSPVVGIQAKEQSLRTRMAFTQILDRTSGTDGLPGKQVSADAEEAIFFQARSLAAELVLPAVLQLCATSSTATATDGTTVNLVNACSALASWDGRLRVNSVGAPVFREFWRRAQSIKNLFVTPFDSANPITTPSNPDINNPPVASSMLKALADAVLALNTAGVPLNAKLGDVQYVTRNGTKLPIPGGDNFEGVFNKITPPTPGLRAGGYTDVESGSSYIQIVSFPAGGVDARGLLTFSQSNNPASPFYADQTQQFANERFVKLPYSDVDIAADPKVTTVQVLTVQ